MKTNISYEQLIDDLCKEKLTMVEPRLIRSILNFYPHLSKVEGDILECGVWRGGVSIFLSHLFSDRNIWVSDSFQGFQPLSNATYKYNRERHTPEYTHHSYGPMAISLEEVKSNFEKHGLGNEERIRFLKGFVKNTLPTSGIEKLALLRIDVDAYSATLEVLDAMYDKVQPGGYVIFDDSCLYETIDAIKVFFKQRNLEEYIFHPLTNQKLNLNLKYTDDNSGFPSACYIVK